MRPLTVEAITDIFQVVMLSAMANLSWALPEESVTSSGRQSRVSGKYLRNRGVNICLSAWILATAVSRTVVDIEVVVVSISGCAAVTSTVSETAPTVNLTSILVRLEEK